MVPNPEILLVHARDTAWGDLAGALQESHLNVQLVASAAQLEVRNQTPLPDVVLIDGDSEHGIDLLLNTRQTASGVVIIVVRKLHGHENLYDATLPGATPRCIGPAKPQHLATLLREFLFNPPPASLLDQMCALGPA